MLYDVKFTLLRLHKRMWLKALNLILQYMHPPQTTLALPIPDRSILTLSFLYPWPEQKNCSNKELVGLVANLFIGIILPMNKQHITYTNIDNWQGTRYSLRQLQQPST